MLHLAFTHLQMMTLFARIGWVDVVALVLILWGLAAGIKRGLEVELPLFLEIAIATYVTFHYYQVVGDILHAKLSAPEAPADLLSFLGIAVASVLALKLFFKLLGTIVTFKFMDAISRAGGAAVGAVRQILAFSLFSAFLLLLPLGFFQRSYSADRSWSGPFFAQTSGKFYRFADYYMPLKLEKPAVSGAEKAS